MHKLTIQTQCKMPSLRNRNFLADFILTFNSRIQASPVWRERKCYIEGQNLIHQEEFRVRNGDNLFAMEGYLIDPAAPEGNNNEVRKINVYSQTPKEVINRKPSIGINCKLNNDAEYYEERNKFDLGRFRKKRSKGEI